MDNDPSDVRNVVIDPKLPFAATTFVLAASLGTCILTALRLGRRTQNSSQSENALLNPNHQLKSLPNHHSDTGSVSDKKKRARDRRKRISVPKSPISAPQSPNTNASQPFLPLKKVIRQPSALGGTRRQRVQEPSISELEESIPEPTSLAESSKIVLPQDIPLPPSPRSVSVSSSPSTSTTPLTPPSIAITQLPLPSLIPEASSSWHWAQTNDAANMKPLNHKAPLLPPQQLPRGRKRRAKSPEVPLLIPTPINASLPTPVDTFSAPFPTLNTLPPPNTPLDAQIEFMRQQVESSRAHENAARAREDELLGEVQRAREEMDRARRDVEGLKWQLGETSQREERLIGQLNALTMQMQHMGMPMPVPLYSPHSPQQQQSGHPIPMPIPYHAYYHAHYARASPTAMPTPIPSSSIPVPMPMVMPPTPTSIVSPTLVHPLLSVSQGTMSVGSAAPSEIEDADAEGPMISYGLVEAIFKRPESFASVSRSRGRDSRASGRGVESRASNASASDSRASGGVVEGKASAKTSDSGIGSMGTRSPTESSSVSGQEYAEPEPTHGGNIGSTDAIVRGLGRNPGSPTLESGIQSMPLVDDLTKKRDEAGGVGLGGDVEVQDDDGVPTPGQELAHHGAQDERRHPSPQNDYVTAAPGVPVFY